MFDTSDKLKVQWGSQAEMHFLRWPDIDFQMTIESNKSSDELQVPLLVVEESINHPILGLNAIEILINNTRNIETLIADLLSNVVNVKSNNIETFVKLMTTPSDNSEVMVHRIPSSR